MDKWEDMHFTVPVTWADLLPSAKVSFALGAVKRGVLGGLLSGALFQYPGALMMSGLGILSATALKTPPPWLEGAVSGEWSRSRGGDEAEWRLEPEMQADGHKKCSSEPETSLKAPPACTRKRIRCLLMMPLFKNHHSLTCACRCERSGCGHGGQCRQVPAHQDLQRQEHTQC